MGVHFEITIEPDTVAPGDLVVLRLVTQQGGVKWTCGIVRCFTDDEDQPAIVLTTGKIPEYDGYALAVWPVALILAVIGAWWPLALVLACGLFEWLGVPERVGAWLGGDRR